MTKVDASSNVIGTPPRVGIICGGGGFTAEVMFLLQQLSLENIRFIIAGGLHFEHRAYSRILKYYPSNERVITVENPTLITVSRTEKFFSYFLNVFESLAVVLFKNFEIFFGVGSYLCLPLFFFGKLKGIKCIYLDSYNRVYDLSATGKIIYKLNLANKFYVLHRELHVKYPKTIYFE